MKTIEMNRRIKRINKIIFIICFIIGLLLFFLYVQNSSGNEFRKKNLTCIKISKEFLINYGKKNRFPNGIPKIIHYNYKSEEIPFRMNELVKTCQSINRDVLFVLWRDYTALKYMKNVFPNYMEMYKSYLKENIEPLKRSDIIRYFILYTFGGVYMDLDTACQKPLSEAMTYNECILSQEVSEASKILWKMDFIAMNSFMACTSLHPFFLFVMESLTIENGTSAMFATGPIFLTKVYKMYKQLSLQNELNSLSTSITLASSDIFSPYVEPYVDEFCGTTETELMIDACEDLKNYKKVQSRLMKEAVVIHLFSHIGYVVGRKRVNAGKSICKENVIYEPIFSKLKH